MNISDIIHLYNEPDKVSPRPAQPTANSDHKVKKKLSESKDSRQQTLHFDRFQSPSHGEQKLVRSETARANGGSKESITMQKSKKRKSSEVSSDSNAVKSKVKQRKKKMPDKDKKGGKRTEEIVSKNIPSKVLSKPQPIEKVVPPPNFIHVEKPAQYLLIPRLHIREFIVRFETRMQVPPKHLSILSNPLFAPEYLSLRHLAIALLKVIDYAEEPPIEHTDIKRTIAEIQRAPEDSTILWDALTAILKSQSEITVVPADTTDEPEVNHVYLLTKLVDLAVSGECIRMEIEQAFELSRQDTFRIVKERAKKNKEWDKMRTNMWNKRMQITDKEELSAWHIQHDQFLQRIKEKAEKYQNEIFELERSGQTRTKPLGIDSLGNTYWLFMRRNKMKPADDLGCRIIVELKPGVAHPACHASGSAKCSRCSHPLNASGPEECAWYEITEVEELGDLLAWIQYEAKQQLGPKPKVADGRSKDIKDIGKKQDLRPARTHAALLATSIESATASEVGDMSVHSIASLNDDDLMELQVQIPSVCNKRNGQVSDIAKTTIEAMNKEIDQGLLDSWTQIETLTRKIAEFRLYLQNQ